MAPRNEPGFFAEKAAPTVNMKKLHFKLLKRFNESMLSLAMGCFFGITASQLIMDACLLVTGYQNFNLKQLSRNYGKIGAFCSSCGLYHFMEFMFKSEYYQDDLSWHDFQIDHSWAYGVAMILCLAEYTVRVQLLERYELQIVDIRLQGFFAQALHFVEASLVSRILSWVGLYMAVIGHSFRIGSMFHAAGNFNHLVQTEKVQSHQLVTTGPYRFSRHPSYFGWFLWATGTQIMLSNFICFMLWFYAAYTFFQDRIPYEEYHLYKFFGQEYLQYATKTPIRIPFVKGYIQ